MNRGPAAVDVLRRAGLTDSAASASLRPSAALHRNLTSFDPSCVRSFTLERFVYFLEAGGRLTESALTSVQANSHIAYQHLLQSENAGAKQLVKVITHPTVVEYTHLAYTAVTESSVTKYLVNNPQHLVILLFFLLRTFVVPAFVKPLKRKDSADSTDDKEEMVDFGLGSASSPSGVKGNFGECEVQWGKEKLRVSFPPPNSPLSALKAELYSRTGVAPDYQKLIYSGAVLKDDLAPLSSFGLVDETLPAEGEEAAPAEPTSFWDSWSFSRLSSKKKLKKLVLLGTQPSARVDDRLTMRADLVAAAAAEAAAAEAGPPAPESEQVLRERMGKLLDGELMSSLEQQLEVVEKWTAQEKAGGAKEGEDPIEKPNPRSLIFLSEAFLQNLLKLDSFEVPMDYAEARKERKAGVKRVQALMDRTDAAKEAAKGLL